MILFAIACNGVSHWILLAVDSPFSALTLLVGLQEGHPGCKKTEWWDAGMAICLERCADLHIAQLMPLPLTVSCSSKIQTGFTFLVPAHPGSPGQGAVKRVCVCVCACSGEWSHSYECIRVIFSICVSVHKHIAYLILWVHANSSKFVYRGLQV